jgi:hypothetical protein
MVLQLWANKSSCRPFEPRRAQIVANLKPLD